MGVRRWAVAAFACLGLLGPAARAQSHADHASGPPHQPDKELVLFLSAEAHHFSASRSTSALNEDAWLSADIVLALTRDRFRLFGEYLLSAEEHDLERLQFGYEIVPNTIVWLGRFHQPASAWNTEHHHGRYLQTSITRPSIELWEDESGVLPQHVTGLLVESRRGLGELGAVQAALGVGLGPRLQDRELDALNVLDAHTSRRRTSWTARLAHLPDELGPSSWGFVYARHRIPVIDGSVVALPSTLEVRQDVYGLFLNWTRDPWHVLVGAYDVRLALEGPAPRKERLGAGYVQLSRQLPRNLVTYARVEQSTRARASLYLSGNHPDFEVRRVLAGLRWDVLPRHAVTLEAGRGETLRDRVTEVRLQWSAALP